MTPPTIPPEAVEAAISVYCHGSCGGNPCDVCKQEFAKELAAAYPHLRRAILEAELPRIVEMAREDAATLHNMTTGQVTTSYRHTPASILDQLTREGA